jgi:CubicO group peptidase (beta-lactamase class C family)
MRKTRALLTMNRVATLESTMPTHGLPASTGAASAVAGPRPGLSAHIRTADGRVRRAEIGSARLDHPTPITDRTTFNVGSVAKQITAHLAVAAARRGELSLDRPVREILPRFPLPEVSIGALISHRSGVRDAESMLSLAGIRELDHYTADDVITLACRQRQPVAPGTFLYSNTNYLLLTKVLEAVSGTSLTELAEATVFRPLGMTATVFRTSPRQVIAGAAESYSRRGTRWISQSRPVTLAGPGSLYSTASDLDRWLSFVAEAWSSARAGDLPWSDLVPYEPIQDGHRYGPGLYAYATPDITMVFHHGHEDGFSAATSVRRDGTRMVCLSNDADVAADEVVRQINADLPPDGTDDDLATLLRSAAAVPRAAEPAEPAPIGPSHTHAWNGTYTCADVPGAVGLSRQDGATYLWRRSTATLLMPHDDGTFTGPGFALVVEGDGDAAPGSASVADGAPECFRIDLLRAPGLRYSRAGAR